MISDLCQRLCGVGLLLGILGVTTPELVQAQQGTITGQVLDQADATPLEAAQAVLSGTNRIETTNREGKFAFRNVGPGNYEVRVLRVGYRPVTHTASVSAGQTVSLTFNMASAAVPRDEVGSTATGQEPELGGGDARTPIDAAPVRKPA